MLNIPSEIKALLQADSVKKNFRVHFPNGEFVDLTNADIVSESVSFTESICSQSELKFGLCESPYIEFECVNIGNIKGATIECSLEIYCSSAVTGAVYQSDLDTYVYPIPYGRFIVDSCVKQADMTRRKVTAFSSFDFGKFDDDFIVLPFSNTIYKVEEADRESNLKLNIAAYARALSINRDNMTSLSGNNNSILYQFTRGGLQYCAKIYYKDTNPLINWFSDNSKVLRYDIDYGFMRDFEQLSTLYSELNSLYDLYINPHIYTNPAPFHRYGVTSSDYYFETREISSVKAVSNRNNKNIIIAFHELSTVIGNNVYETNIFNWPGASTDDINTTFWGTCFKVEIYAGTDDSGEMVSSTGDYRDSCNLLFASDIGRIILESDSYSTDLLFLWPKRTRTNIKLYKNRTATTVNQSLYLCDFKEIFSMNLREIIGAYCELRGMFGRFSRDGKLSFKQIRTNFDPPNAGVLYKASYRSAWYEDFPSTPIGKIECTYKNSDGTEAYFDYDLVSEYSSNKYKSYDISNNFFIKNNSYTAAQIQSIVYEMANNVSPEITYIPSNIECMGLPYIESGDVIEVETDNGNFITLIESRTLTGVQSLVDSYASQDDESSSKSGAASSASGGTAIVHGMTMKVLWENPDIDSSFSAQTITLSESVNKFDYIGIVATAGNSGDICPMVFIPKGNTTARLNLAVQRNYERVATLSDNTISFSAGRYYTTYGSSGTTNSNSSLRPYQVIGFKNGGV